MATYYLWSGATGTASGADWTNAFTTLTAAATAANAEGDIIKVHKTTQVVFTSVTFTAAVYLVCVDKDASDALAEMDGVTGYFQTTTTLTLAPSGSLYLYGLAIQSTSAATRTVAIANADGVSVTAEKCRIGYVVANNGSARISGASTTDLQTFVRYIGCTFVMAGTGSYYESQGGKAEFIGCTVELYTGASAPTEFIKGTILDPGGCDIRMTGCDLSVLGSNSIVGSGTAAAVTVTLTQCKLGTSFVLLGTQSPANMANAEVFMFDCASGDTHGVFGYANGAGSVVSDTGIYYTTGAAGQSWKIVTTAACNFNNQFVTPFIDLYHTGTSSITPYLEILRDGSATAYQDDEVWAVFTAKTTSGTALSTRYSDRMTLLGTPANQDAGAGLGSWTGESGTAWSGKIDSGSAFTPAEAGHIRARVSVGEPSITVYVDPQIRT